MRGIINRALVYVKEEKELIYQLSMDFEKNYGTVKDLELAEKNYSEFIEK